MGLDWGDILEFTRSPLETAVRGTLMFWLLFAIFRVILRRDVGAVGISDFLFVVVLGDAAQNAMIGEATSVSDGAVLIFTLVAWNVLVDHASFRFPAVARLVQPRKLPLVRNGKPLWRNMRRELITMEELRAKLREEGHANLDDVRAVYMEADGVISVLAKRERD